MKLANPAGVYNPLKGCRFLYGTPELVLDYGVQAR